MMVEPFKPEHVRAMELQPAQARALEQMPAGYLETIAAGGPAATMRTDDGTIIACAGSLEMDGEAHWWAFFSRHAPRHMFALYKGARRLLDVSARPVFASSPCNFTEGCRLLEMLGFELKDVVELLGEGHLLYVRD